MSHQRFRADRGFARRLKRGPSGRALCRYCQTEVPRGRRTFCGDACVHEWRIRTDPQYVRALVFRRDHGVCAICGIDTVAQAQELEALARPPEWIAGTARTPETHQRWVRQYQARDNELRVRLKALGIPWARWEGARSWGVWDADHIIPVAEGGGECGLDNYRTLCLRCHKAETRRLQRRLHGRVESHELP